MASDILSQLILIEPCLAATVGSRIQQHFAPITTIENGDVKSVEKSGEKSVEVWSCNRSCQLLRKILQKNTFSEEQIHHLVDALLHKLTLISKGTEKNPDDGATAHSIVELLVHLMNNGLLGNTEHLNIIATGTDLINSANQSITFAIPLATMSAIMRLCSRTTAKANQEVLKMVSEKLGRNQLKSFIKSFISHFDNRKKMNDLKGQLVSYINTFADFIRMLETVLEKSDLKPVFGAPDAPFRGFFQIWSDFISKCEDKRRVELLSDVDAFFTTLRHPARYNEREKTDLKTETDEELNGIHESDQKSPFKDALIFPKLISHKNRAQSSLTSTVDFMEFSRDLGNMKIEDELEKVLIEPEMTCLVEEDAKHEAFSTRIGRSFTFQKRGSLETGRGRGRSQSSRGISSYRGGSSSSSRTVYRKTNRDGSIVTRPAAMHVDEYQKAEEGDSDHEKDRSRNYSSGDTYDRGPSPRGGERYRDRSPLRDDRYRDRSPMRPDSRRGGYRGSDRGRGGYRGSPSGRGRGSFRGSRGGSRGMPRY